MHQRSPSKTRGYAPDKPRSVPVIQSATLYRLDKSPAGTFGVLSLDGRAFCATLEPPDRGNASDLSCIPEGSYRCGPVDSPHFGRVYEILDVPGRTHILMHPGNTVADTHGCVLLGRYFGALGGERAVLQSTPVVRELRERGEGQGFDLRVVDVSGA